MKLPDGYTTSDAVPSILRIEVVLSKDIDTEIDDIPSSAEPVLIRIIDPFNNNVEHTSVFCPKNLSKYASGACEVPDWLQVSASTLSQAQTVGKNALELQEYLHPSTNLILVSSTPFAAEYALRWVSKVAGLGISLSARPVLVANGPEGESVYATVPVLHDSFVELWMEDSNRCMDAFSSSVPEINGREKSSKQWRP